MTTEFPIAAGAGAHGGRGQRGLGNMQLRAHQLHGSLQVASSAAGTTLTLRVPPGPPEPGADPSLAG